MVSLRMWTKAMPFSRIGDIREYTASRTASSYFSGFYIYSTAYRILFRINLHIVLVEIYSYADTVYRAIFQL